ncbi:MAG: MliC family protein [bacterium]
MKKIYIAVVVLLILGIATWIYIIAQPKPAIAPVVPANTPISQVDYLCSDGKTINAKYYQGEKAPQAQPGEMPTPTGSVKIVLSDGRQLALPQTISGSGIRYATASEAVIFWSKGNGSFIMENNVQTYSGCIALAKDSGGLSQVYANATSGFSIRYPAGYIANSAYQYQDLGLGKEISGIKFTIPAEIATGTNLSSFDTGVSVELISNQQNCVARLFLYRVNGLAEVVDNDVTYSVATSSGAGAGNFYEETVWAIPGTNPCVALRYFIHSTNIDNYPKGAVKEFNRQALLAQFDAIRKSLILSP